MKFFINKYAPFWRPETINARPVRYQWLTDRTVITCIPPFDEKTIEGNVCRLSVYDDGVRLPMTGYVPIEYMEAYQENLPHDLVDFTNQTPSLLDAEQYITYAGKVFYNACGQACLAEITGLPLLAILDGWKAKDRKWWETFFNTKRTARGTSDGELKRLANTIGYEAETLSAPRYTPAILADLIGRGDVIASVNVDPTTHQVNGSGVLHWVVVEEVFQERAYGGTVKFYNSLTDAVEICSWLEWMKSAKQPYGVMVEKGNTNHFDRIG